jgi:hypothetical protein
MKILRALVSYLASSALQFLAFASPLESIDYDGYVDTTKSHNDRDVTLMNQITTQNHKDVALLTRVPGDTIEARQVPIIVIPAIGLILFLVADVFAVVILISEDNPVGTNDVGSL